MEYLSVEEARGLPGMRLVLTAGVPGPWSELAKAIFKVKGLPFRAVRQEGAGDNEALVAWTGHANAPTAVWNDEPPRAGREQILLLAERLAPEPRLLPTDPEQRALAFGLAYEIAGEEGFGWCRRHSLLAAIPENVPEPLRSGVARMRRSYGYSPEAAAAAPARCAAILAMLARRLHAQAERGSPFFVGDRLGVVDLTWATFSNLVEPLPDELNPMPGGMRRSYHCDDPVVRAALDPVLLAHRDRIFAEHIGLPLDF